MKCVKVTQLKRGHTLCYHKLNCQLYRSGTVWMADMHARKIGIPCARCHEFGEK